MEIEPIQESLLAVMPYWNYRISKPFKHLLDDGVSMEMYYCLQIIRGFDEALTMTELSQRIQMSKQQMTKIINRLVERGFVKRIYDPSNRRIIKIQITDRALDYIEHFLKENAECFRETLEAMDSQELADFKQAIDILTRVLSKLPRD
ncbi:MAG: MarR family transcriptional regulator [Lachnospiraceae bacterium]|nr:MarR family transcriptional regulator [Lachnospiraceae bacterium]